MNHQLGASKEIILKARMLRKKMTKTEKLFWERVRKKQLGQLFRRQHPMGIYIVDFYCHQSKLIIEIDGDYHNRSSQIEQDYWRDETLKNSGFKILRFTDQEVLMNLDQLIEIVKNSMVK